MNKLIKRVDGFSLIELLVAALVFTVVAGGVFSVLLGSQLRYQSDSGLTSAFQQANLVMDQITRDIHSAGYPPVGSFNSATAMAHPEYFAVAFPWSPSYPFTQCMVNATCTSPAGNDLLLEAEVDGSAVQWIRYTLDGVTLKRGLAQKQPNTDPLTQSSLQVANMLPYLENVVNPSSAPIFTYSGNAGAPVVYPGDIYEVNVCLIVRSAKPDPQTGQLRKITVTGQAVRFNPNQ
jgi:prepilin-type N-terminal cleavage/methylation domain-containing protein